MSRKCEHGMMPWECIDCAPSLPIPEDIKELLQEILEHQVANLDTDNEFYICYTYKYGEFPPWVNKVKEVLKDG